eukprot:GHUV01028792.1.p1 GENE.GHUV01028792.1~~GHUV01028792.1.p1  ORF type:complete len:424 (+),score=63.96 GHUV01028792.1:103-1374(+)
MLVDSRPVVSAPVWATDGGACTGVCTCKRLKAVLCSLESLATALKHIPCTNSTRIGAMRLSVPTQQSTCPSTSTCKHAARPSRQRCVSARAAGREVTLLDYGAGNVRSVRNAIKKLGYSIKDVEKPSDIAAADKLIFPGVGTFGQAMDVLKSRGYIQPLVDHIQSGKPFFGICLGLQLLFEGSTESGGHEGLGIIKGRVSAFDPARGLPVPHIGWNTLDQLKSSDLLAAIAPQDRVYFVHTYRAMPSEANADWVLATSHYGEDFVAAVCNGNAMATQFHPEKSGTAGLEILRGFLEPDSAEAQAAANAANSRQLAFVGGAPGTDVRGLARRVIACLDVRSNDNGDLVVTKGDQYDVREKEGDRDVRNLGKPVDLAARYFAEGADEVAFLNITGFRDCPLEDLPMLQVWIDQVVCSTSVATCLS